MRGGIHELDTAVTPRIDRVLPQGSASPLLVSPLVSDPWGFCGLLGENKIITSSDKNITKDSQSTAPPLYITID